MNSSPHSHPARSLCFSSLVVPVVVDQIRTRVLLLIEDMGPLA